MGSSTVSQERFSSLSHQLFICIRPMSTLFFCRMACLASLSASSLLAGLYSRPLMVMQRGLQSDSVFAMATTRAGGILNEAQAFRTAELSCLLLSFTAISPAAHVPARKRKQSKSPAIWNRSPDAFAREGIAGRECTILWGLPAMATALSLRTWSAPWQIRNRAHCCPRLPASTTAQCRCAPCS